MSAEQGSKGKLRPWSRWQQLASVSPSGKTLFVCTVCGRSSPTPDLRCSKRVKVLNTFTLTKPGDDPYIEVTCAFIENKVREQISKGADRLKYRQLELKVTQPRYCTQCMGWGCVACGGAGEYPWTEE